MQVSSLLGIALYTYLLCIRIPFSRDFQTSTSIYYTSYQYFLTICVLVYTRPSTQLLSILSTCLPEIKRSNSGLFGKLIVDTLA